MNPQWLDAVENMEEAFRRIMPEIGSPGELGYEKGFKTLSPTQRKFVLDLDAGEDLRPNALIGSYGGGKSLALVFKLLVSAAIPKNRIAVFRKFRSDLLETTFDNTFRPILERLGGYEGKVLHDAKDNPTTILQNGTKIFWKGLYASKSKQSGEPTRLGSTAYGAILIDEAQELDDEKALLALIGRKRWPAGQGFFYLSIVMNPPEGIAWLADWMQQERIKVYKCPIEENEENLPEGYVEGMKQNFPVAWQKKFLKGEIGTLPKGKPAYKFGTEHFKKFSYNPRLPLLRGWDFGTDYGTCVIGQFDESPRLCILDLILVRDSWTRPLAQTVSQRCLTQYTQSFLKCNLDFVDGHGLGKSPTSDITNEDILLEEGFTPIPVIVQHKVRIKRINEAAGRYVDGMPFIVLNEDMPELCMTLSEGYCVDGEGKIVKDKYFEHIGDAFTYLVMGLFSTISGPDVLRVDYRNFEQDMDYFENRPKTEVRRVWEEDEGRVMVVSGGY